MVGSVSPVLGWGYEFDVGVHACVCVHIHRLLLPQCAVGSLIINMDHTALVCCKPRTPNQVLRHEFQHRQAWPQILPQSMNLSFSTFKWAWKRRRRGGAGVLLLKVTSMLTSGKGLQLSILSPSNGKLTFWKEPLALLGEARTAS